MDELLGDFALLSCRDATRTLPAAFRVEIERRDFPRPSARTPWEGILYSQVVEPACGCARPLKPYTYGLEQGKMTERLEPTPDDLVAADLWVRALKELESTAPGPSRLWTAGTKAKQLRDDNLLVIAASAMIRDALESKYGDSLEQIVSDIAGCEISITFAVGEVPAPPEQDVILPELIEAAAPTVSPDESPLIERYVFETFVTGPSNSFAHAAALAVAEQPGRSYNPLFIYGGAGLGKTHLLHAIGHESRRLYPGLVVRYVSSETFMNDFITHVREDRMAAFRRKYRESDVLLIDDIQFLSKGEQTQDEFFHTFNALYNDQRQVVITSDRPPGEIPTLEERLRTRFEWGLITDVQPPDLETRVAILQKKAAAEGVQVPNEILELIASRVQNNIRELEGRLTRVVTLALLTKQPLTLDLAKEALRPLDGTDGNGDIPAETIIAVVGEYFGVSRDEMVSKTRTRHITHARQIAQYLCRELTTMSLPKLGEIFGGRDHTTVLHSERRVRKLMGTERAVFQQVQELTARLRGGARRVGSM